MTGDSSDRSRAGGRSRMFPDGIDQIQLYWSEQPLLADLQRCHDLDWEAIEFDASTWADDDPMHDDLAKGLGFPSWYGRNLDALADCSLDLAAGRLGFAPGIPGGVLLFRHFDRFARRAPGRARAVLDIFVTASSRALQHRWALAVFVQSDDPDLRFSPVAATVVAWNRAERNRLDRSPPDPSD